MDLISLACQEVGLDLSSDVLSPADDLEEPFAVQLHITEEERVDRLETMVPRQLSYQPDQGEAQGRDVLRDVLKEVGVAEMSPNTSIEHIIKSPVQQLLVQRRNPKFFKRPGSSQMELGIKGAPCRKLSQLNSKSNAATAPVVEPAPSSSLFEMKAPHLSPVSIQPDNPFKYLLANSQPGQVAFAYYVMECWEREEGAGQYDDQDKFLKQCSKWWTAVPTVYRREYWAREQKFRREIEQQRTWSCGRMSDTDKENVPPRQKMKKEAVSLVKAFNRYVSLERAAVSADMEELTAREVRRELGRRWKLLSQEEKMSYLSSE